VTCKKKKIWRFPESWGTPSYHPFIDGFSIINPPNHPFIDGFFHYKPFILGYPHDYGNMRSSEGGSADFDSYRFSELEKRSLEM